MIGALTNTNVFTGNTIEATGSIQGGGVVGCAGKN
jgi:hypothetical protein